MKKFNLKSFVAGILCATLITVGTAYASGNTKNIDAVFGQVKLIVNGKNVEKETLLYDGRTYLPLRDTADALGMDVTWNEKSSTAGLYDKGTAPKEAMAQTETTKETSKYKMYEKYKDVPDFGKMFNINTSSVTEFEGATSYKYDVLDIRANALVEYAEVLVSEGYEYFQPEVGELGYKKGNIYIYIKPVGYELRIAIIID